MATTLSRRYWHQDRPADELHDRALARCSLAARGAFFMVRAFIRLHCDEPGRLTIEGQAVALDEVSFLCHVELSDLEVAMSELLDKKVARRVDGQVLELSRELAEFEIFQEAQRQGKRGWEYRQRGILSPPSATSPAPLKPPSSPPQAPLAHRPKAPLESSPSPPQAVTTRARVGSGSGSGSGSQGECEGEAERTPSPKPSALMGEREAEAPTLAEAEQRGAAWPGDLARGIPPGIPLSSVNRWHNYREQKGWPADWERDLVAWHRTDWLRDREHGKIKITPVASDAAAIERELEKERDPAKRLRLMKALREVAEKPVQALGVPGMTNDE